MWRSFRLHAVWSLNTAQVLWERTYRCSSVGILSGYPGSRHQRVCHVNGPSEQSDRPAQQRGGAHLPWSHSWWWGLRFGWGSHSRWAWKQTRVGTFLLLLLHWVVLPAATTDVIWSDVLENKHILFKAQAGMKQLHAVACFTWQRAFWKRLL